MSDKNFKSASKVPLKMLLSPICEPEFSISVEGDDSLIQKDVGMTTLNRITRNNLRIKKNKSIKWLLQVSSEEKKSSLSLNLNKRKLSKAIIELDEEDNEFLDYVITFEYVINDGNLE